ncbi:MAG: histidinol dehydrogenase [Nitrospinae bacterium]|nr:histidinol dehydrogenase [Nitrospinota bacterium]
MITLDTRAKDFSRKFAKLENRFTTPDPKVVAAASAIVDDVRKNGDRALFKWTEKLDGLKLTPKTARVDKKRISNAAKHIPPALKEAMVTAFVNIVEFHAHQCEQSWVVKNGGARVGQIIRPLRRVGLYVPGGKATYPSSVLMNAAPAIVAGVEEIAICSPAPKGHINPAVLFAAELCGITEFYQVGGAQAVAAMAYGTKTIKKVDKIVGPGNAYVAEAKRLVFGAVDIDMIAGPSEICIVADDTANPAWCAADILSQAEHDEMALPVFLSHSAKLCSAVTLETYLQAQTLERRAIAQKCLDRRFHVIKTSSLSESLALADRLAMEHLELAIKNAAGKIDAVKNAGAVFVGHYSPEVLGDYLAGPNHVLPTSGSARFSSPLGVYDFIKRSSLIEYSKSAFAKGGKKAAVFAEAEGLTAHANAAKIRLGRLK